MLRMTRTKKLVVAGVAAGVVLLVGGGIAYAAGKPSVGLDDKGTIHVCVKTSSPYYWTKGNVNNTCGSGFTQLHFNTGVSDAQIQAAVAAYCTAHNNCQGPKGDTGATGAKGDPGTPGTNGTDGKDGKDAQALPYGVALVNVDRGNGPTTWGSFTTTIGSPAPFGDQASGTFRMSCSAAQAPCKISVKAYATTDGVSVYPRLDIMRQPLDGGPQTYCEYADGSDNNGGSTPVGSSATAVPLGVGGSLDCGSSQTLPANGVVDDIEVPAGRYDISPTIYFKK